MKRIAAVLAAVALAAPFAAVPAQSQTNNAPATVVREVVVSSLEADGAIENTQVSQFVRVIKPGTAGATVTVPGDALTGYRVVSGFGGPADENGDVVWRPAEAGEVVAVADVEDRDLPISFNVTYYLDDEEMEPDAIRGRSGVVRMEIELTNTTRDTREITYTNAAGEEASRTTLVYLPLEYAVSAELPAGGWTDLRADGGVVQTDERGVQLVTIPGALNPPVGPANDTVMIQARSEDILLPALRIVAIPRVSGLHTDALDETAGTLAGLSGQFGSALGTLDGVYGGTLQIAAGLEGLLAGVGAREPGSGEPVVTIGPNGIPTTVIGALGFLRNNVRDALIPPIGRRDPATGRAVVTIGANGLPTTIIGALGFVSGAIKTQLLPGVGTFDPATGRSPSGASTILGSLQASKDVYDKSLIPAMNAQFLPALDGLSQLAAGGQQAATAAGHATEAGIFAQMQGILAPLRFGASNAAFTSPQPEIDGRIPLEYRLVCGSCFDPSSPSFDKRLADPANPAQLAPKFQPGLVETFRLFSTAIGAGMKAINTGDPANPGLVEGLQLAAGGLDTLVAQLNSNDPNKPGLVEGLALVRDGATALVNQLHTLDASKPGVVDGLEALLSGTRQASTGLFAVNQLVLGTAESGAVAAADNVALDAATLRQQAEDVETHAYLASGADVVSTTYVFEVAGQSSTGRDNAVRGGLVALAAVAAVALGRRPRLA